jgi:hypothetical protein
MKFTLSLTFFLLAVTSTCAFVVQQPVRPSTRVTSAGASTSALFDSKRRQTVAKRTAWLEKRGISGSDDDSDDADGAPGLKTDDEELVIPDTGASSEEA